MSRDIEKAHTLLRGFWPKLSKWYSDKYPNQILIITHVDRTPVEQLRLFCQGRLPEVKGGIVTEKDGFVHLSKHNLTPSRAFDVAIMVDGKIDWSTATALNLANATRELGYAGMIAWGGSWSFHDYFHFEVL